LLEELTVKSISGFAQFRASCSVFALASDPAHADRQMLPQDVLRARPELSLDSAFAELWGDAVHRWGGRRGSDTPGGSAAWQPHCSPTFEGGAQAIS